MDEFSNETFASVRNVILPFLGKKGVWWADFKLYGHKGGINFLTIMYSKCRPSTFMYVFKYVDSLKTIIFSYNSFVVERSLLLNIVVIIECTPRLQSDLFYRPGFPSGYQIFSCPWVIKSFKKVVANYVPTLVFINEIYVFSAKLYLRKT